MKNLIIISLGLFVFMTSCTKDKGKITMQYNKATAIYADIDDIRSTPLQANSRAIENPGKIFINGNLLLIGEENEGIHVFDNSNPENPVNVSFIQLPFTKEFYVEDHLVYAESQYDFLKIDISDINAPKLVNRVNYAFGEAIKDETGATLVGFKFEAASGTFKLNSPEAKALKESSYLYFDYMEQLIPLSSVPSSFAGNGAEVKGTLNKIALSKDHVYVVGNSVLHIFDNTAANLSYIDKMEIGQAIETIYPENDHLFIGTESSMIVMSVANAPAPQLLSEYEHPNACDPVLPNGKVAYLTLRTLDFSGCDGDENSLVVLDITDINDPQPIHNLTMKSPYALTMINNYLFVGEGANGLAVFDAADARNPEHKFTKADILAYDIMKHPDIPNRVLTTGESGLQQYSIDYNTMDITLLSHINY